MKLHEKYITLCTLKAFGQRALSDWTQTGYLQKTGTEGKKTLIESNSSMVGFLYGYSKGWMCSGASLGAWIEGYSDCYRPLDPTGDQWLPCIQGA